MIEIFKALIEKPEDLKRHVIYLLKIIISVIIATRIYAYLFGAFEPILIGDKNFWKDVYVFFTSGKVLIVAAIFFFAKYFILELVSAVTFLLISLSPKLFSAKINPVEDASFFRFIFKHLGILKFQKERDKMPQPGKNFHSATDFVNSVNKNDLQDAALEIRNTSIFELFNLYFVFSLVYFFILNDFQNNAITIAIVICFIVLVCFLISIEYVFNIIELSYENFSKSLRLIKQIHITEEFIKNNGFILPDKESLAKNLPYINEVKIINDLFYIAHYSGGKRVLQWLSNLEKENANRKILLITNEPINKGISAQFNKDLVKVIRFKNEKKFVKKLEAYFFGNKKNENIETN